MLALLLALSLVAHTANTHAHKRRTDTRMWSSTTPRRCTATVAPSMLDA